jgi:hypothetical protein
MRELVEKGGWRVLPEGVEEVEFGEVFDGDCGGVGLCVCFALVRRSVGSLVDGFWISEEAK